MLNAKQMPTIEAISNICYALDCEFEDDHSTPIVFGRDIKKESDMHKENSFNIDEWLWDEFNLSGVFYGQTNIDDVVYTRKQIGEYEICFVMDNNKKYIYDASQQYTRRIPNDFNELTENGSIKMLISDYILRYDNQGFVNLNYQK